MKVGIYANAAAEKCGVVTIGRIIRVWTNNKYVSVRTDDGRVFVRHMTDIVNMTLR
jgi:hypothetical protein